MVLPCPPVELGCRPTAFAVAMRCVVVCDGVVHYCECACRGDTPGCADGDSLLRAALVDGDSILHTILAEGRRSIGVRAKQSVRNVAHPTHNRGVVDEADMDGHVCVC